MKKIFLCFIAVILTIPLMLSGCRNGPEIYEYGDFLYRIMDDSTVFLEGLSEQGKEKNVIVVPEQIEGKAVEALSYRYGLGVRGELESDLLTSLYIIPKVRIYAFENTFELCKNLCKVIIVNVEGYDQIYGYQYNNTEKIKLYFCSGYTGYNADNLANVSFMYNYEQSPNDGYYWIDDVEYGTKIGIIPENPEREGYVFGGWFKEPECINKWDIETDVLPEERTEINEDGEDSDGLPEKHAADHG